MKAFYKKDNSENDAGPRNTSQEIHKSLCLRAPADMPTLRLARVVNFWTGLAKAHGQRETRSFSASKLRVDHHELWTDRFQETQSFDSKPEEPSEDGGAGLSSTAGAT